MTTIPTLESLDEQTRRRLAAEAIGWTAITSDMVGNVPSKGHSMHDRIQDPDTDPAAALQLVEWLRKEGWDWSSDNKGWHEAPSAVKFEGYQAVFHKGATEWQALEPTFCRAVTSAFLKALNLAI